MNVKIRKGDTVEVISGNLEDKGKRGEVITVQVESRRIMVQGVNIMTKHQKPTQTAQGRTVNSGRIKLEGPLHISNVMLVCPKCNKATRVSVSRDETVAHRICKHCQALID
jgi:large subunit ribosomal protein L24